MIKKKLDHFIFTPLFRILSITDTKWRSQRLPLYNMSWLYLYRIYTPEDDFMSKTFVF